MFLELILSHCLTVYNLISLKSTVKLSYWLILFQSILFCSISVFDSCFWSIKRVSVYDWVFDKYTLIWFVNEHNISGIITTWVLALKDKIRHYSKRILTSQKCLCCLNMLLERAALWFASHLQRKSYKTSKGPLDCVCFAMMKREVSLYNEKGKGGDEEPLGWGSFWKVLFWNQMDLKCTSQKECVHMLQVKI